MNTLASPPDLTPSRSVGKADGEKGTLARAMYEQLKRDIFEFRMPPGQRYSEHELALALDVSRTPLRIALHILAHEGYLLHTTGHSSWQVRPLDLSYYEDLYDFRVDIETLALRRLCAMQDVPDLSTLRAFWCAPPTQRVMDGHTVAQADEAFHRTLVSLAGNREMLRAFNELTERIRIIRKLDFVSTERITIAYEEHAEILRMLQARKAETAEMLMKAHIEASRVEIRRITFHHMELASPPAALLASR